MHLIRRREAVTAYEYGCDLQRLYPWEGVVDTFWGAAIAHVQPGECTTPHAHDESETFVILSGSGTLCIDDESERLEAGDVAYIPKNASHCFKNESADTELSFLTIFWDSPESMQKIRAALLLNGNA
jgi:mannose-6-phosphate isomerase-like protein (cupin superfamily)